MKSIIEASGAPKAVGPYSLAVKAGGFVFCSGQIPLDASGQLVGSGVEQQTEQVMKNIQAVLTEAGVGFNQVVKTTIYLTDMADFQVVNQVYAQYFKENLPARSTVAVKGLPKGALVEIEVLAVEK